MTGFASGQQALPWGDGQPAAELTLELRSVNSRFLDLHFRLPDELRRSDGTLLAPVSLDTQHCVTVDRRLTGSTGGQWMLAAIDASGYAASHDESERFRLALRG